MSHTVLLGETRRKLIFLNLIITAFAANFLSTALMVALTPICAELNISVSSGQWLTSAFSLATAIIMPLSAFLITTVPTRKLYLGGLFLFVLGLAGSVIAQSFGFLLSCRILQAASGGVITAMAQVILLSIYPQEKQGTIMGWYGLATSAAPIISPTLSGIIIDISGWRSVFGLSLVVAIISLVLASFIFRNILTTTVKGFDVTSFTMSIFGFGGITLGIGNITNLGITSPFTWIPLVIGVIGLVLFCKRQLHLDIPFLELRVMKQRDYVISLISGCILMFVMMGYAMIVPIYSMQVLGVSATVSGLILMPASILTGVVAPVAGKIYDKLGIRRLFFVAACSMFIGNLGMVFVGTSTAPAIISLLHAFRNLCTGCLMMPLTAWAMSTMPISERAHGTALMNTVRNIFSALGTAILVGVVTTAASLAPAGMHAVLFGVHVAFGIMATLSVLLILIPVFLIRK